MSAAVSLHEGKAHLRVISDSELRTVRACLRRHRFAYGMRRRPIHKDEALRFGSLWHKGQEAWWRTEGPAEAKLEAALVTMRAPQLDKAGKEIAQDPFALVMAEELMLAYTARWGSVTYRVLAVEAQFEMPLVNPTTGAPSRTFARGGKIDAVVEDAEQHIVEHKTTTSDIELGSNYWKKVRALDSQVSTYLEGARSLGFKPKDCIYDVVRKPALRPLKATPVESRKYTAKGFLYANQREADETPDEYRLRLREDIAERVDRYFARGEIVRLEAEEEEHAHDVWQMTRLLREAETSGFAPRNPDACSQFSGCPYLAVCQGEASIDDNSIFYTANTAHEELSE